MNDLTTQQRCLIIGASHAGVTCAFALRKEGYRGAITLIDKDPHLPYHRPPLSKTFLTGDDEIERYQLKAAESYQKADIELRLGQTATDIDKARRVVTTSEGKTLPYDHLVLATGASALIPPIEGIKTNENIFVLRSVHDVHAIKKRFISARARQVVIIGGGFIGLELAASFRKLAAEVTVLEREPRLLSRVTSVGMSGYFQNLHQQHGVRVMTDKEVARIQQLGEGSDVQCADGTSYPADLIILGTGIRVNVALAAKADLEIGDGIRVTQQCQTSADDIWAIGDCTSHFHVHYQRQIRLESVQNATDQSKVAAASICGKATTYDSIPWFWSDQYDVKLQMVGLSEGYDTEVTRIETDGQKRSTWYFKGGELLAVDAINNPKAYVLGTKFIKSGIKIDRVKLVDLTVDLKEIMTLEEDV